MRRHWRLWKMALRAAVWRATAEPPAIGLRGLAGWTVAAILFLLVIQVPTPNGIFSEYGLGLLVGAVVVSLAAAALALPAASRITALAAMLLVGLGVLLVTIIGLTLASLHEASANSGLWTRTDTRIALFLLQAVWMIGAYAAIIRGVDPERRYTPWRRAAAAWALQTAVLLAFPHYPAFVSPSAHDSPPNMWTTVRALMGSDAKDDTEIRRVDGARVELAQPALMDEAIARLAPQVHGQTDVYAIGLAGWAEQDVFVKELDGALAAFGKTLPIQDRVLRLVNHADTVERIPAAVRANFAAAVRAVARVMDRQEDVLVLFMTSHGSPDGIALRLPGLISTGLAPEDVAGVLDREGIRNRIVVVSACYSGVFVKPLANDNTIVLTAADDKSTSFGCSNEREWTYFGDALFNQHLKPDVTLEEAFLNAKTTIGQWEARDDLTPSNPQGHFGPALVAKLAQLGVSRQARAAQP
jgi:hypothetical protein